MIEQGNTSWFLILYSISVLGIAVFVIRIYANRFKDLKEKIHSIHEMVELIDESLMDDTISRDEMISLIKRFMSLFRDII